MIAGRLTMRATVERDLATAKDAWGGELAPAFAPIGSEVPCFIWSEKAQDVTDASKVAEVEDLRGLFALGADLEPNDEISAVTNRRGEVLLPGRLRVMGPVQRKHTHLEAQLRRIA